MAKNRRVFDFVQQGYSRNLRTPVEDFAILPRMTACFHRV
jgi:hypothetical protein